MPLNSLQTCNCRIATGRWGCRIFFFSDVFFGNRLCWCFEYSRFAADVPELELNWPRGNTGCCHWLAAREQWQRHGGL